MNNAKWIWAHDLDRPDEIYDFFDNFEYNGENTELQISVDSNYELYINGVLAAFGQYPDYPYDKVYDKVDVTRFCKPGKNELKIRVWYFGVGSQTYAKGLPGLIYEITGAGCVLCCSSAETLCAEAPYVFGKRKYITGQMGISYTYDARKEGAKPHSATEVSGRAEKMRPRSNKKLILKDFSPAVCIAPKRKIYDLGCETVGFLGFKFKAPAGALITVSYGEYIAFPGDGEAEYGFVTDPDNSDCGVRRRIHTRDFSFEFYGNGEWVEFSNFMRRLGLRYLQVECEEALEIAYIGVYPTEYLLNVLPAKFDNQLLQRIYDTCVRTLRLCMFDHYEDCPWREQALYTLDGKNQMLCGYYAFEEYEFPRSALELIGHDYRDDGLLHICSPSYSDLVIPFFSLVYIIDMKEYTEHSKDLTLADEFYGKMLSILDVFLSRAENGLVPNFHSETRYWNFYEWNEALQGSLGTPEEKRTDIVLNAAVSMALDSLAYIASALGKNDDAAAFTTKKAAINEKINAVFLRPDGLYDTFEGEDSLTELGNSLAILCGAASAESGKAICEKITSGDMPYPTTLSMRCFKYDALLKAGEKDMREYIISEIARVYGYMLNCGATSFWETEKGAHDFGSAGSLCHGWSAVPIIYLLSLKRE